MKMYVLLFVIAVITVFLAYTLYNPIPPRTRDPFILRFTSTFSKIFHLIGCLFEITNLGSYATAFRIGKPNVIEDPEIESQYQTFNNVAVRVYKWRNIKTSGNPGIIFIHGGGFIMGSIEAYDKSLLELVKGCPVGTVAMSVGYRLAPEYPFPIPVNDCFNASTFFVENAANFGVDQSRIAIVGSSSGGTLAAAVLNKMIMEKFSPLPKLQILIYPALQGFNFMTPSILKFDGSGERGIITSKMLVRFWINYAFGKSRNIDQYLRNAHISGDQKRSKLFSFVDDSNIPENFRKDAIGLTRISEFDSKLSESSAEIMTDPYFSPLLVKDDVLEKVPRTFIITTDFDPLRDDGLLLVSRFNKLCVPVEHCHLVGHDHGIFTIGKCSGHKILMEKIQSFYKNYI